jgi:hypothetical protein
MPTFNDTIISSFAYLPGRVAAAMGVFLYGFDWFIFLPAPTTIS